MHLLLALGLILILEKSATATAHPQKRDEPSQQTLVIPVKLDQNQRYSVGIVMGSDQQSFNFALSTSTGYSAVAGDGCSSCDNVPSYNASESSTLQNLSGTQDISLVQSNASGSLIRENCGLRQTNGSTWAYPNQTLIMANQSSNFFSSEISGVIGLGTNARDGNFSATVYSGWFSRNPSSSSFTYGMALNPPSQQNSSSDGGVLHWLAPDPTFYQGDVSWKNLTPLNSTSSVQSDWFITMDGFWFLGSNGPNISQSGDLTAIVDPYYPTLTFPQSVSRSIYASVTGASLVLTNSSSTNVWEIPCSTEMGLTLTFGSLSVTLDESSLVRQSGALCFGSIEEWVDQDATEYLLGSSVVSALYIIFSISNSSSGSIGFAHRKPASKSNKLSGGAIAGIVLGACAFVLASISLGIILYQMRKRRQANQQTGNDTRPDASSAWTPAPTMTRADENAVLLPFGVSSPPSSPGSPGWISNDHDTASTHEGQVITFMPSTVSIYTHTTGTDTLETPPPYAAGPQNESATGRPLPLTPPRDRKRGVPLA